MPPKGPSAEAIIDEIVDRFNDALERYDVYLSSGESQILRELLAELVVRVAAPETIAHWSRR